MRKTDRSPGKADSLEETTWETARREAAEEIGLPSIGQSLPPPFQIEHLCELPANLAKTELVVRPCVALLHSYDEKTGKNADPEVSLIPRLDAKEVAAVFTAPFHNFLRAQDEDSVDDPEEKAEAWYQGSWTSWHESDWRSKLPYIPARHTKVAVIDTEFTSAPLFRSPLGTERHQA